MTDNHLAKVKELANAIRNKDSGSTSLFLAVYETIPHHVWEESIKKEILTIREWQACLLVLKQYRKAQAIAAIQEITSSAD